MSRFVLLGGLGGVVVSVIQLAHYVCMQVNGEIKAPRKVLRCSVLTLKCVAVQKCYTTLRTTNWRGCVDLQLGADLQIFNPGVQMHLNTWEIFCVCLQPRQTVLTAAGSIGQASGDLLRQIGENETDERFQVRPHPPATDLPWSIEPIHVNDGVHTGHTLGMCSSVTLNHVSATDIIHLANQTVLENITCSCVCMQPIRAETGQHVRHCDVFSEDFLAFVIFVITKISKAVYILSIIAFQVSCPVS